MISSDPFPARSVTCRSALQPRYSSMRPPVVRPPRTSRVWVVLVSLKRYQSMSFAVPKVPDWAAPLGAEAVPAAAHVPGRPTDEVRWEVAGTGGRRGEGVRRGERLIAGNDGDRVCPVAAVRPVRERP